jgi:hypothetical protein
MGDFYSLAAVVGLAFRPGELGRELEITVGAIANPDLLHAMQPGFV